MNDVLAYQFNGDYIRTVERIADAFLNAYKYFGPVIKTKKNMETGYIRGVVANEHVTMMMMKSVDSL